MWAGYRLPNEAAQVRARLGVVSHLPSFTVTSQPKRI